MKYPCNLIQDLLPLYVEDMASRESKEAVEEHLQECPECREVLENLRQPQDTLPPEAVPLQKVKRRINARRWKSVAAAVLIVLAGALSVISYLTAYYYLPYSEELVTIEPMEDGGLHIQINGKISGTMLNGSGDAHEYELEVIQSHIGNTDGGEFTISPEGAENARIYFLDYRHEDILIYGEPGSERRMTLPRLALNYYLLMAAGLAVILGVLALCFRKQKTGKVLFVSWLAPVCYLAGHLCIMGFSGTSVNLLRDLKYILAVGGCLYAAVMLIRSMYQKKELDVG